MDSTTIEKEQSWSIRWLTDVPAEIRFAVYRRLFRNEKIAVRYELGNPSPFYSSPVLSIFLTCKEIQQESRYFLFEEAIFEMTDDSVIDWEDKGRRQYPFRRLQCTADYSTGSKLLSSLWTWVKAGHMELDELYINNNLRIWGSHDDSDRLQSERLNFLQTFMGQGSKLSVTLGFLKGIVPRILIPIILQDTQEEVIIELDTDYNVTINGLSPESREYVLKFIKQYNIIPDQKSLQAQRPVTCQPESDT